MDAYKLKYALASGLNLSAKDGKMFFIGGRQEWLRFNLHVALYELNRRVLEIPSPFI